MRALLAFLLLHANELVSSDRLIDEVWGPEPPKTAGASLQNYVSRLRKALGPELIVSQPPGYLLRVDPELFDLARFERLTAEARGVEPRERAEKLRAALSLWRGPALEDLAFESFVQDEVGRLEEARLAALEERIDAELELGSGAELIGELEELVEQQPLRERFHAQLMLALYRAGRQANALDAYQEARRVLIEGLGLEPGEELRTLQQAILQQDPKLGAVRGARTERAPDRRTVTVLFCDLVDSTPLARELDPEVYRRLISRYFDVVRERVERHGGMLEKFIGDAVMAVFGVPELHEDDALRAVRAAVEVQAALGDEDWDVPLTARIGISTGEVHVLSAPDDDLHVSGAVASVAAQLEGRAGPGGILLSNETHRLVRDAVRTEPAEDSWRLEELLSGATGYARRLDAPLVGREGELERLRAAYENACDDDHCHVVTVVGEAGIGKTRLAREFVTSVRDNTRVLVGRCASYGDGATYLPIAEMVRQALADESLSGIRALLKGEEDAEPVAQRIAELSGIAESPAAPGEAFWAVRRFLESIAKEGPVLVALDDIHWAEPTLLDLVEYLGRWAEGPIVVVCLARRDLLERRQGWGGPTSTGFIIDLEPLPPETLGKLIQQLADEPVDPHVHDQIVEHAGGNPLFAEQLLALSTEAPELMLEKAPPTVEALLASRLDRLDPRELEVLRRAAVVGRLFSRAELGDLAPQEDPTRQLVALTERGLVHPGEDLFRFHHVLVREVAYRGIPKAERSDLHERAARGLDARDGSDELVGYHFEQAYRYVIELKSPDEPARKLARLGGERLGRAGLRAWRRADVPAALNLLTRSVQLLPDGDELRSELGCELGAALHARGDLEGARDILAGVVEESAGNERVAFRARIEHAFVTSVLEPDRAPELLEIASAAIPTLESYGDDRALGRAWLSIGHIRGGFHCQYAEWADAASRAAAHYRRSGWSPSNALGNLGVALYYGPTPVLDGIRQCEALLEEHAGDRASEANILVWMGGLESMRGDFKAGRALVSRAKSKYQELGLTTAVTDTCGQVLGAVEMNAGRPEKAEQALREGCALLRQMHQTAVLATRAAQLAQALYAQGQLDEAELWTGVARDSAGEEDLDARLSWQPVQAKLLVAKAARDEAELLARETLELVRGTDALNRQADALLVLAEILRLDSRLDEAEGLTAEALRLYELKGNVVAADMTRTSLVEAAFAD